MGGLGGRFLYLPLGGGTECSTPRPPCPLRGGQPGLRPPPSPSHCYPVKLLSRWFCQDTRAFLEGYRIKQEELATERGSIVWEFPPLPTLSPHGPGCSSKIFFSCSIKWLWNDASLLRSPFSGSSGSGWSMGPVLVNERREEVMCDALEHR